jgi:LemA protein
MNLGVLIWGIAAGILGLIVIFMYNHLVSLKNKAHNALSNIDVQLKKRYDLIPQLVDAVKGYMQHEKELLEKITALRSRAASNNLSDDQKVDINNQLSRAIGQVMVNVESYPDLKASNNFMHLQRSLTEVEEQLSASRRSFNMSVTQLNTTIEKFPSNIIANIFGFKKQQLFEATGTERHAVSLDM